MFQLFKTKRSLNFVWHIFLSQRSNIVTTSSRESCYNVLEITAAWLHQAWPRFNYPPRGFALFSLSEPAPKKHQNERISTVNQRFSSWILGGCRVEGTYTVGIDFHRHLFNVGLFLLRQANPQPPSGFYSSDQSRRPGSGFSFIYVLFLSY